ncbi:hypothetical protein FQN53_003787 [Emmonsiellopsis sp. PD_33]|nr:hypothetical protein FQN53_003787 [Emmonsiellopsis sp. PD_33]
MVPSRPIEDEQTPSWRYRAAEIEPYDGPPGNVEHTGVPVNSSNICLENEERRVPSIKTSPRYGSLPVETRISRSRTNTKFGVEEGAFNFIVLQLKIGIYIAQRITAVGTVPDKETFINGSNLKVRKFKGTEVFDDNFETVVDIRLKQRTMDAFSSPRFPKLLSIDEAMYESLWRPTVAPSGCPRSSGQWPTSISQDSSKTGHELRVASSTGS